MFLMVLCLIIGLTGVVMAQNEGKHLGSTQDVQRTSNAMHSKSVGPPQPLPANDAGGKYKKSSFAEETGMYLEDGWLQGYALLTNGSRMDHLMLRYDIYNQQMQFIIEEDTLAFSDPDELDHLLLEGRRFVYEEFENKNVLEKGYFEVLKDGDCKLLKRRTITHHIQRDGIANDEEENYLRDVTYFIKKEGKVAREVRTCKKSVLCAFEDEEVKVKQFIKTNKLKMKSCEDLMQVVAFYNSLH
jgi:hypothetical protein